MTAERRAELTARAGVDAVLLPSCRDRLFKYRRNVDYTDALPRQDNGKIYKRLLRDRYGSSAANEGEGASAWASATDE